MNKFRLLTALICCTLLLVSCTSFHLQQGMTLAAPIKRIYVQAPDPYGYLVRDLKQYLRMSKVEVVESAEQANVILDIQREDPSQDLLSVSGTQQTRQYRLGVTIIFVITDALGRAITHPQTLSESRIITMQSNQILGSSNEVNLFYQQIRRGLALAIMNCLASAEMTQEITNALSTKAHKKP